MDAYDIFKKLTRGAKFKKEKSNFVSLHQSQTNLNPVKLEEVSIKIEKIDDEYNTADTVRAGDETTLTLVKSMVVGNNKKRGTKRKATEDLDLTEKLEKEKVNHYRNINNIKVVGRHVPDPAKTFDDFDVSADLIENLRKCGYTEPTPVQKQAIPILLQARQLLACAPTGSGKTAAFLLPIIHFLNKSQKLGFRALVLCPTRELAKQTQRECVRLSEGRGLSVHIISKIKKAPVLYGAKSSKKYDLLITTPKRLCYLLNQDLPGLSLKNVKWIVVDEVDKLFETGQRSFRDQLKQILDACTNPDKKMAMFSATYTPAVAKWCVHNMKGLIRVTVGQRNAATDLIDQELVFVGNEYGKLIALRDIIRKGVMPPVLVFVQSKERAQQLFNELIYDGINVDAIHSDRTQLQRDNTVRSFREGRIWVLICTELMARGIDFKGVNLVINYDFPSSSISYVHRIGRAGRAGRRGKAITFFTTDDTINLKSIAHIVKQSGGEIPDYMTYLKKRSKKERRKLQSSAPLRKDITTTPARDLQRKQRRKQPIKQLATTKKKQKERKNTQLKQPVGKVKTNK